MPVCTYPDKCIFMNMLEKLYKHNWLAGRHGLMLTSNLRYSSWNKLSHKPLVSMYVFIPCHSLSMGFKDRHSPGLKAKGCCYPAPTPRPPTPGRSCTVLGHWYLLQWNHGQKFGHTQGLWSRLASSGMQLGCEWSGAIYYLPRAWCQAGCLQFSY